MSSDSISLGSQWVITRRLDADTIRHFAEITGDTGAHHIGQRGIAHGLLVAAVPTEIGGRLSFLGREMRLVFHRPVPAGTTVSAAVTVSHLGPVRRGWSISLSAEVTDSERNLVLTADADGRLPGDANVSMIPVLPALMAAARLSLPTTPRDVVEGVRAIPYGRSRGRHPHAVLETGQGTCSTKHYLLAAALAELDPPVVTSVFHRVYRLDRHRANQHFGPSAAAAVPPGGLIDVHTYLRTDIGRRPITLDVTFPHGPPWDGRSPMDLACADGLDVPGGPNPERVKRELVRLHCQPAEREAFIAAL